MAHHVRIISRRFGGLAIDAEMLVEALADTRYAVSVVYSDASRTRRALERLLHSCKRLLTRKGNLIINLHCQEIPRRWLDKADLNVLIPNQEWARPPTQRLIHYMDAIFCKSRHAADIYQQFGKSVFIGFSSPDCLDTSIPKDYGRFLHIAGKSYQKGTRTLLRIWGRHPEWPALLVVTQRTKFIEGLEAPNIQLLDYLSDQALQELQNSCGIHLCPSEAEGFGHTLCEGMSVGAVFITTDAPPMHEVVPPGCGMLVRHERTEPQYLGTNFFVDEIALEQAIHAVMALGIADKEGLSRAARAWYSQSKEDFHRHLQRELHQLVSEKLAHDAGTP